MVTGGASGIGRAMAARFAAAGMDVVIADVEAPALAATADELGVTGVVTDVSDAASVQALADAVMARHGRVDLLCNNAGVGGGGHVVELELADGRWVLGVNLWGVIHGLQSFLPHLVANPDGAHVVNTASMAGLAAFPGAAPYCASKFAVVGLSEALQQELAADGADVGVSVLCPGFVRTNIFTSQRNRPADLRVEERPPLAAARAVNADMIAMVEATALDPAVVADAVHDAVLARRFWIFTHPDLVDHLVARHDALLADKQ